VSFLPLDPGPCQAVTLPPEIAFLLVEGLPVATLARIAEVAQEAGTDAAAVAIHARLMGEDAYYRALARHLGLPFLDGAMALDAGIAFPDTLIAGSAPLAPGQIAQRVLAPRTAEIGALLATGWLGLRGAALTTPLRLREAVLAEAPEAVAAYAADHLRTRRPDWSTHPGPRPQAFALAAVLLAAAAMGFHLLPAWIALGIALLAQALVLTMTSFRLGALLIPGRTEAAPEGTPLSVRELPVYTVLVGLYREAAVVPRLVKALKAFDYPAIKLDIKFLIEADDGATAAALAREDLPAHFEVLTVPPGLPRTKPRALNAALPLARGACLVVYDAEDVPEPGQLRLAAETFARADRRTACLQGRLVIDNAHDSWLTRCFSLEYGALFDVLGPALAVWRMPTPLGGTSTHFRTAVLREVHGWDAWNVTEDADLGMRLAVAGYHVGDLPSPTLEEAPADYGPWLRQRTRWMKGFMQTTLTHGRHPLQTLRRLGPLEGLCAVAMLPGTVLSALLYPPLLAVALYDFLLVGPAPEPRFLANLPAGVSLAVFLSGLGAMLLPAALVAHRRGWRDLLPSVWLLPAYFVLVSLAAWLAVIELVRAPNRWNKTEHGVSRTTRSGLLKPVRPAGPKSPVHDGNEPNGAPARA